MGFYFDQTRCTGCYACMVACRDWHEVERGPVDYMDVAYIEKPGRPNPYVAYMVTHCFHCADPSCASACPVSAIGKRAEDGIVTVDRDLCLGKDECALLCKEACPYGMPRFGDEENAKMQMCDSCPDRLAENKNPICVDACIARALDAGPLTELIAKYGRAGEAEGFTHSDSAGPSAVFRPKAK